MKYRKQRVTPESTLEGRRIVADRLCKAARAGNKKAMARMIELYYPMAKGNCRRYLNCGLDFEDLLQNALLGIVAATERYDGKTQFTTYAMFWIKAKIARALNEQARAIRLPANIIMMANSGKKKQFHGDELTNQETEALRSADDTQISNLVLCHDGFSRNGTKLRERMEIITDDAPLPDEVLDGADMENALARCMECLSPRDADVIKRRYGIGGDGEAQTLAEIGDEMDISRERVRQIQREAMAKMRKFAKMRDEKLFCES